MKVDKFELIDFLKEISDRELATYKEAQKLAGMNSPGANQALGAIDTVNEIIGWLEE